MRLKIFSVFGALLFAVGSLAAYAPGDTVNVYINDFMLILQRSSTPKTAVIRKVGESSYILTLVTSKIPIGDFYFIGDTIYAGCLYAEGYDPQYMFYRKPGDSKWTRNNGANSLDETGDMSIYRITAIRDTFLKRNSLYFATSGGLLRAVEPYSTFEKLAGFPIYDLVAIPGTYDSLKAGGQFIVASSEGVYRVTSGMNASSTDTMLVGGLPGPIYAVAINPEDPTEIYAGSGGGLFKWNGSAWEQVPNISAKVNRILYNPDGSVWVATEDGIYRSTAEGWRHMLLGDNVRDIAIAGDGSKVLAAVPGVGVYLSQDGGNTWTLTNEGLEVLYNVGSKNANAVIFSSNGDAYLGTDVGVYKMGESDSAWVYISDGIGSYVGDETVESFFQSVENPFGDGESIFSKVLSTYGISKSKLFDVDGDDHYFLVPSPFVISTNLTDKTITPIYGYWDPLDEDTTFSLSNRKEIFVLNTKEISDFSSPQLQKVLAYLFSRYVAWSLDPDEDKAVLTGEAAFLAYKAGFDLTNGLVEGNQYLGSPQTSYLNYPLYSYTIQWVNPPSPIAREMDRERMFLWLMYLNEQIPGDSVEFFQALLEDTLDGKAFIKEKIESNGYKFYEFFRNWALANFFDDTTIQGGIYGYKEIDVSIPDNNIEKVTTAPGTDRTVVGYGYKYFKFVPDTLLNTFVFNGKDSKFFYEEDTATGVVDTISAFNVVFFWGSPGNYQIDQVEPDRYNRIKYSTNDTVYVAIINRTSSEAKYVVSKDVEPPEIHALYALQNRVIERSTDVYLVSMERLFSDVDVSIPVLEVNPMDTTYESMTVPFESFASGNEMPYEYYKATVFVKALGDVELRVFAQDKSGNDISYTSDTISLQSVGSKGGNLTVLNGSIELIVPENSINGSHIVLFDRTKNIDSDGFGPVFSIGHEGIHFSKPATLVLRSPDYRKIEDGFSLMVKEGDTWVPVPQVVDREDGFVQAQVEHLGLFQIRRGTAPGLVGKTILMEFGPNPVKDNLNLRFLVPKKSNFDIEFYDVAGRLVRTERITLDAGIQPLQISLRDLKNGIYFLKINTFGYNTIKKMVVLH